MSLALHHLVYQSFATTTMSEQELATILATSRQWNTDHQLTGILLYSHGDIMQVLEGPLEEVEYIFSRILQDKRHFSVIKLADGPIQERNFSQWSMGFRTVDPTVFQQLAGYQNPHSPTYLSTYSENGNESLHSLLAGFITEDQIRL